jgi:hypothetical protein
MLTVLTADDLEERERYGLLDTYTAAMLRRLRGPRPPERTIPSHVEIDDDERARRVNRGITAEAAERQRVKWRDERIAEVWEEIRQRWGPNACAAAQAEIQRRAQIMRMQAMMQQQARMFQSTSTTTSGTFSGTFSGGFGGVVFPGMFR